MSNIDRIPGQDPREALNIPPFITIEKNQPPFVEGTLGGDLFIEALNDRQRPTELFNQHLDSLFGVSTVINKGNYVELKRSPVFEKEVGELLVRSGISNLTQLLQYSQESLVQQVGIQIVDKVKQSLSEFLGGDLLIAPEGLVVARALSTLQNPILAHPISPAAEKAQRNALYEALLALRNPKRQEAIILRYGLRDGISKTLGEVALLTNTPRLETIRIRENDAHSVLRQSLALTLKPFISFPPNSLAIALGITCEFDLRVLFAGKVDFEKSHTSGIFTRNELERLLEVGITPNTTLSVVFKEFTADQFPHDIKERIITNFQQLRQGRS